MSMFLRTASSRNWGSTHAHTENIMRLPHVLSFSGEEPIMFRVSFHNYAYLVTKDERRQSVHEEDNDRQHHDVLRISFYRRRAGAEGEDRMRKRAEARGQTRG